MTTVPRNLTNLPADTTWRDFAADGAKVGVTMTFLYALAYAVYAIIRSSATIRASIHSNSAWDTVLGTAVSLIVGIVILASLISLGSAVAGALTAIVIRWALATLNPGRTSRRAILVGALVTLCIWGVVSLILMTLPASRVNFEYSDTYLFWVGIPGLLYIFAGGLVGWRQNNLYGGR